MAKGAGTPRSVWLVTAAAVLIGVMITLGLWICTEQYFLRLSQAQAALNHQSAHRHLSMVLHQQETVSGLLSRSLATSARPQRMLNSLVPVLLDRFPALLSVELYGTDNVGTGPGAWQQIGVVARKPVTANPRLHPAEIPYWRAVVERAWERFVPGVTPLSTGSDSVSANGGETPTRGMPALPSVHLFWPVSSSPGPLSGGSGVIQPAGARWLLGLRINPDTLLEGLPSRAGVLDVRYQIFDLNSQSPHPIATTADTDRLDLAEVPTRVLEKPLSLTDRRWLLRSTTEVALPSAIRHFLHMLLLLGLGLTLVLALLVHRFATRLAVLRSELDERLREQENSARAIQNLIIEKDILSRALQDGDQRTRDFVELGDSFCAELDEQGRIGFISPQVAALVDSAPAELSDRPFTELLADDQRPLFQQALRDCERQRQSVQLDTLLELTGGATRPTSLRFRPIVDGLGHCQGFRIVGRAQSDAHP